MSLLHDISNKMLTLLAFLTSLTWNCCRLVFSRLWDEKNTFCNRCRLLVIILVLLSTFGGVGAVGQIGGGVALGRKNGAKSENTERSRNA